MRDALCLSRQSHNMGWLICQRARCVMMIIVLPSVNSTREPCYTKRLFTRSRNFGYKLKKDSRLPSSCKLLNHFSSSQPPSGRKVLFYAFNVSYYSQARYFGWYPISRVDHGPRLGRVRSSCSYIWRSVLTISTSQICHLCDVSFAQPVLTGTTLPTPSFAPMFIGLGVGTQNYTCASTNTYTWVDI